MRQPTKEYGMFNVLNAAPVSSWSHDVLNLPEEAKIYFGLKGTIREFDKLLSKDGTLLNLTSG